MTESEILRPVSVPASPRHGLGYVPSLDGLRGVAILSVMVFHADETLLRGGFIGVDVFFVLSGFLITTLLVQEFDQNGRICLRAFYLRRVLRLIPALVAMLVFICALSVAVKGWEAAKSDLIDAAIALFYSTNWARALRIRQPLYVGHTWSLSAEEQFYLLWPLVLHFLLRRSRSRWLAAAVAASIALGAWGLRVYMGLNGARVVRLFNGLDTRADALMIGCAIGVVTACGLISGAMREQAAGLVKLLSPVALAGLGAVAVSYTWLDAPVYFWALFLVAVLSGVLVLNCFWNRDGMVARFLGATPLVWIGSVSYGLYLWHYPIFITMWRLGFPRVQILLYGSAAAFAVAALSYYLLERPFLRLKSSLRSI